MRKIKSFIRNPESGIWEPIEENESDRNEDFESNNEEIEYFDRECGVVITKNIKAKELVNNDLSR